MIITKKLTLISSMSLPYKLSVIYFKTFSNHGYPCFGVKSLFLICSLLSGIRVFADDPMEGKSNAIVYNTKENNEKYLLYKDRVKRQVNSDRPFHLTKEQEEDSVKVHNMVRRLEPASDMEFIIWNDYLAKMAQDWAETCIWDHGQPTRDKDEMPFYPVGQNLYYTKATFNLTRGIILWYEEKEYYDYENMECNGPMCGHYTQVVWGESREMGCAYNYCETMIEPSNNNKTYYDAHYFVCEYGPAGNIKGERPYKKGGQCEDCKSGAFWCDTETPRGLCRRDCSEVSPSCECMANCQNYGTAECNCTCSCQQGYVGTKCQDVCQDYNDLCGKSPGYPKFSCKDPTHGAAITELCPLTCEACTLPENVTNPETPAWPECLNNEETTTEETTTPTTTTTTTSTTSTTTTTTTTTPSTTTSTTTKTTPIDETTITTDMPSTTTSSTTTAAKGTTTTTTTVKGTTTSQQTQPSKTTTTTAAPSSTTPVSIDPMKKEFWVQNAWIVGLVVLGIDALLIVIISCIIIKIRNISKAKKQSDKNLEFENVLQEKEHLRNPYISNGVNANDVDLKFEADASSKL